MAREGKSKYDKMNDRVVEMSETFRDVALLMDEKKKLKTFSETLRNAEFLTPEKRELYADAVLSGKGGIMTQIDFANRPPYDPVQAMTFFAMKGNDKMVNVMKRIIDYTASLRRSGQGGGDKESVTTMKLPVDTLIDHMSGILGNDLDKNWNDINKMQEAAYRVTKGRVDETVMDNTIRSLYQDVQRFKGDTSDSRSAYENFLANRAEALPNSGLNRMEWDVTKSKRIGIAQSSDLTIESLYKGKQLGQLGTQDQQKEPEVYKAVRNAAGPTAGGARAFKTQLEQIKGGK